jgi:hypothetical protein
MEKSMHKWRIWQTQEVSNSTYTTAVVKTHIRGNWKPPVRKAGKNKYLFNYH